jgi:hypothetical protein
MPLVLPVVAWFMDDELRSVPLHLLYLFLAGVVLHGRLAAERPKVRYLTEYFFWIALGGVLGGSFNSLVAPVIFSTPVEYPLILLVAVVLAPPWRQWSSWRSLGRLDFAVPLFVAVLTAAFLAERHTKPLAFGWQITHRERNFFGVLSVFSSPRGQPERRLFRHGRTDHGGQRLDAHFRRLPLFYYYHTGPVGQMFVAIRGDSTKKHVGVIGLGAGTLATYGEPGQEFTFFEIDPAVVRLSRRYFTFLEDSPADCRIVLGDGRLTLAREPDAYFDILVIDAFSSDSVPVHLLTQEALELYLDKLAPHGIIAVHVSNRSLDLESVVASVCKACKLRGISQNDVNITDSERNLGKINSHWILLARDGKDFGTLLQDQRWQPLKSRRDVPTWTDDYSNPFSVVKWEGSEPVP